MRFLLRKYEFFLRYEQSRKRVLGILFLLIALFDHIRPLFLLIFAIQLYGEDSASGKLPLLLVLPFRRWELLLFSFFTGLLLAGAAVVLGGVVTGDSLSAVLTIVAAQFALFWSLSALSAHFTGNNVTIPVTFFLLDFFSGMLPHAAVRYWNMISPLRHNDSMVFFFFVLVFTSFSLLFLGMTRSERWA